MKDPETKIGRARPLCAAAVCTLVLVVAGCGDDGEDQPASTAATSTSTTDRPEPYRGGEKSIEEFGSEAEGSEEEAIVGSFKSYLTAIVDGDSATACSYLASSVHESLEEFATKDLARKGCAAILPKILAPTAEGVAWMQVKGEITKVRVEDDRAFVIFHAPGAKLLQMNMIRETGRWKAALASPSILVPDL